MGSKDGVQMAPTKNAWIYIGNCLESVSTKSIENYLKENNPSIPINEICELKTSGKYKSFKLGADFKYVNILMSEETWPERVKIRRFNFPRNSATNENFHKTSAKQGTK